jgi:hypothetical protein
MQHKRHSLRAYAARGGTVAAIFCYLLWGAATTHAQLLYSFESDLEGWFLNTANSGIALATSASGATLGLQSMEIKAGPNFSWNARVNEVTPGSANYDAFNAVAADLANYTLDFDVTLTPESFSGVIGTAPYFLVMVAVNSDSPNFPNVTNVIGNVAPGGVPQLGTYQASVPMTQLPVAVNSSFYQINIGSNYVLTDPTAGQSIKYYIDNVRFSQAPMFTQDTLFSWETPDDPATLNVNEQLEGWIEGFGAGHTHSISTTGATAGSSALEITRTIIPPSFTWGSQFVISASIAPDPSDLEADFDGNEAVNGADFLTWQRGSGTGSGASRSTGDANGDQAVNAIDLGIWQTEFGNAPGTDANVQATIDDLVDRIESADKIAFDVTLDDPFPANPTFLKFALHFSDETGVFYQKESENISVPVAEETTVTVTLDLDDFADANASGKILGRDGFVEGTRFLRIGLASNTNDGATYQIDNLRLLTEVTPALNAVPEPTAALLGCWGAMLLLAGRRQASYWLS